MKTKEKVMKEQEEIREGRRAPTLDSLMQERAHRVENMRRARPASWRNEILTRGHPRGMPIRDMMEQIEVDPTGDGRLTAAGRDALKNRYMSQFDNDPQDVFRRVAAWYTDTPEQAQRMYGYIAKHWIMPATPVLTNGGTDRGLPISCYLNDQDDTMSSIIDMWTETALLSSKGGGVGTSYNRLRAIGEPTRGGKTSGAVSFAKVEDSITLAVSQGDVRRGSAAVYMEIDHPEIEDFMMLRDPSGDINRRALNLHLGICLTDEFMHAVRDDTMFSLRSRKTGKVVKEVHARDLYTKIVDQRLKTGEPYIIHIDTVNRLRPQIQKELGLKVSMSNLCSEITLPTGPDHLGEWRTAVCCLTSLNALYYDDWKDNEEFFDDIGVFIDNVLEDFIQRAPESFWRAIYSAFRERSVGIGLMGLHSYVQSKGIPYGSPMTVGQQNRILKTIRVNMDRVSKNLAYQKGPCPDGEDAGYMERFTNKMAIAPTASISTICGGVSACCEPIPANVYIHKTLDGNLQIRNQALVRLLETKGMNTDEVWSSINAADGSPAGSVQHLDFLDENEKELFKTSFEIDQGWQIDLARERSVWVDQASSTNLFVPATISITKLLALHYRAWAEGVKSLYYLRSQSVQRAGNTTVRRSVADDNTLDRTRIVEVVVNEDSWFECEACQ